MSGKATGQVWELDLPLPKLVVMLALADRADQFGNNIYPGAPLVAWMTGYSERQVRRIIKELIDDELLVKVKDRPGKTSVYRIDFAKGVQKAPYGEDTTHDIAMTPDTAMSPLTSQGEKQNPTPDMASLNLSTNGNRDERLKREDVRANDAVGTMPATSPSSTTPSKESQAVSSAKTPPPTNSARPPAPGRQRFKVYVRGGQDKYADGAFIRADTTEYADACHGIFYAWLDALDEAGRRPDTSTQTLWDKNRDAIFALAQNRRTPEQVAAFVLYAYSEKYPDDFYRRQTAPITLAAVGNNIAGWLSKQKPKRAISFEERKPLYPERERLSPEDIARRLALKEQILAEGS